MRFHLEYRDSVREYLRSLSLSRNGRVKLYAGLLSMTAEVPDAFRSDPANRPSPSSPFYFFNWIFSDGSTLKNLYVVVDDSTADYGVLRIVYADCQ